MVNAMNVMTGETVRGEVVRDNLVSVKDIYTGDADVYAIGTEVDILDNEPFPLEMHLEWSDVERVMNDV